MYPVELEIKDMTQSNTSASYLDLLLSIGRDVHLHTSIYDKRDDFTFHITNFPFLRSNIATSPAYGVFISQLIRYARACSWYGYFILRTTHFLNKLLEQRYVKERLESSLKKFYGRYVDLIKQFEFHLTNPEWHFVAWPNTMTTLHRIRLYTNQWHFHRIRHFTELWQVSIEHLRRVWHADRGALLLRIPGPVPLGTCICSTCWDQRYPISIRHSTRLWHYYRAYHYWTWHFKKYWFP